MHIPPRCFGSILAYEPGKPFCQACPSLVACGAEVAEIRPSLIAFLDRVSDRNGRPKSWAWLTREERAARKKMKLDDETVAAGLTMAPDTRNGAMRDRAARKGIDPLTCSLPELSSLSRYMSLVVDRLKMGSASKTEITDYLVECSRLTPGSAARTRLSLLSFLKAYGRIITVGGSIALT